MMTNGDMELLRSLSGFVPCIDAAKLKVSEIGCSNAGF